MTEHGTPNLIEVYEAAAQEFRQTLSGVRADQMSNSTPCSLWNVQNLLNHNIRVAGFVRGVLTGNITVNPQDVEGPLPPEGALQALDAGVAQVSELIKTPGALNRELNTPFGVMSAAHFMVNPFADLLIHRWDLAKATSQTTVLDGSLVEACYNFLAPNMNGIRSIQAGGLPIFGPAVAVLDSASLQEKLIGMVGRQP